ncbi:MAG: hypothetical protein ABIH87_02840 [bacterium]
MVFLATLTGVIVYRIVYFTMLFTANILLNKNYTNLNKETIIDIGWETLFTSILSLLIYIVMRATMKKIGSMA